MYGYIRENDVQEHILPSVEIISVAHGFIWIVEFTSNTCLRAI